MFGEQSMVSSTLPEVIAPSRGVTMYVVLFDTSYAVGSKPGVCLDERPDSPAAAWYVFIFFPEKLLCEQLFWEKDGSISIFLEKKLLGTPLFLQKGCPVPPCRRRNDLPGQGPRNACYLKGCSIFRIGTGCGRAEARPYHKKPTPEGYGVCPNISSLAITLHTIPWTIKDGVLSNSMYQTIRQLYSRRRFRSSTTQRSSS